MQVLVTDVTGIVGRVLARQLLAAGHEVTGVANKPDEHLDPDVDLVCVPLGSGLVQKLADNADVVVHLAPLEDHLPGSAGIGGVVQVSHVAARAGARLLFVSHAAGRPELYEPAEELVVSGWAPSLVIRAAPLLGRQHDWAVCRTVVTLLRTRAPARKVRPLHFDDLIRFLVQAVATDRTGVVDVATPDNVDMTTARRLLRLDNRQSHSHRIPSWRWTTPQLDTTALYDDWKFDCGWSATETFVDTVRGLNGRRLEPTGAAALAGHVPMPLQPAPCWEPSDGAALQCAAPDEVAGEFDDRIDPRFPVFSAAGLTDALPGPLTPMTIDIQLAGLRIAVREMGNVLALHGVIATEWESRGIAVFGHRPYIGVSTSAILAEQLPGWNEHDLTERALGGRSHDLFPLGRPHQARNRTLSAARAGVIRRTLTMLRHLKTDTESYRTAASGARLDPKKLAVLSEAHLEVRIQLLRDWIHQGWSLIALWVIDNGITAAAVQRTKTPGPTTASGFGMVMESRRVTVEAAPLVETLRHDPQLCARAGDGDLDGVRAISPTFAADVETTSARLAHHGPGEAELANPVFGDDRRLLLTAAAATAAADPTMTATPPNGSATLSQRMVANTAAYREMAHDATMRFTHELRITLREIGTRRVGADLIDDVADVYYLTCDELLTMPADARLRIKRRRAERERLQALYLPDIFEHTWAPTTTGATAG